MSQYEKTHPLERGRDCPHSKALEPGCLFPPLAITTQSRWGRDGVRGKFQISLDRFSVDDTLAWTHENLIGAALESLHCLGLRFRSPLLKFFIKFFSLDLAVFDCVSFAVKIEEFLEDRRRLIR